MLLKKNQDRIANQYKRRLEKLKAQLDPEKERQQRLNELRKRTVLFMKRHYRSKFRNQNGEDLSVGRSKKQYLINLKGSNQVEMRKVLDKSSNDNFLTHQTLQHTQEE